jgi:hypothetical protein
MDPELFDGARARIESTGFSEDVQTLVSLFVCTAKGINAALLGEVAAVPIQHAAQEFLHSQLFRETEAATLLGRVTKWSANLPVYGVAAQFTSAMWAEFARCRGVLGPALDRRAAFNGLAFGHALLARIRLAPVIPDGVDEMDPFVVALRRIEADNGRLLQLQLRLLQHAADTRTIADADDVVEREQHFVDDLFADFLRALAQT